MRELGLGMVAMFVAGMLSGCGSVVIGGNDSQSATNEVQAAPAKQENVDCDAYMQQIADECFKVTAFQDDGTTPLRMYDEAGNDLGEVDQAWAAGYCECYAQLAFQTFGCTTVIEHNKLDDAAYDAAYEPIRLACSSDEQPAGSEAAPAAEGAPAEAAPAAEGVPAEAAPAAEGN